MPTPKEGPSMGIRSAFASKDAETLRQAFLLGWLEAFLGAGAHGAMLPVPPEVQSALTRIGWLAPINDPQITAMIKEAEKQFGTAPKALCATPLGLRRISLFHEKACALIAEEDEARSTPKEESEDG